MTNIIFTVLAVPVAIFLYGVYIYNNLIRKRNTVRNAWGDVEVFLQKRHDLALNLVESVKSYQNFEKSVLENVTQARSAGLRLKDPSREKFAAENALTLGLQGFFAVVENYPDLKASTVMQEFQKQINDIETSLAGARRYFNAAVREYNNFIEVFPHFIIANSFNFKTIDFFDAPESVEAVPLAKFQ